MKNGRIKCPLEFKNTIFKIRSTIGTVHKTAKNDFLRLIYIY